MMKYLSKKPTFLWLTLITALVSISACSLLKPSYTTNNVAVSRGFKHRIVQGGDFDITTYQRITDKTQPYVFYIEGDGKAFKNKRSASHDPTPTNRTLIQLASIDTRPNVVYIARPCQYSHGSIGNKCNDKSYWTNKRLSDESVDSINQVITKLNQSNTKFSLVGYSGGGGIAVLIAARNHMVKDIITIAGNLDLKTFSRHNSTSPMIGSLDPIDYASEVSDIPQLHLSGGKDMIVPPLIAHGFVEESESPCVKTKIFPDNTHTNGWIEIWKDVLAIPLTCY